MKEEKYEFYKPSKDSKIRILPSQDAFDWLKNYTFYTAKQETDEDKLDKIDIQVIERYLRRKKMNNINVDR